MIYLDMDGVIVDFIGGIIGKKSYPYPLGSFDIPQEDYMSKDEDWWANLEWTLDGKEIYESVKHKLVFILTTPCNPASMFGKMRWISKNLPEMRKRVIFTQHKYLFAHPRVTLIDDSSKNCTEFTEHGGKAFCIPRLWNHLYKEIKNVNFIAQNHDN